MISSGSPGAWPWAGMVKTRLGRCRKHEKTRENLGVSSNFSSDLACCRPSEGRCLRYLPRGAAAHAFLAKDLLTALANARRREGKDLPYGLDRGDRPCGSDAIFQKWSRIHRGSFWVYSSKATETCRSSMAPQHLACFESAFKLPIAWLKMH